MSENKNLWVGILLGGALTALLMFVLYQQAAPLELLQQSADKTVKSPPIIPKIPEVSYSVEPERPLPAAKQKSAGQTGGAAESVDKNTTEKTMGDAEAIGLPEGMDLSEEELKSLSEAERKEYDAMLKSYREVRDRVLHLHQEREQLQERMDKMFEQNETMERKLGEMREAVSQHEAGKAVK